MEIGVVIAPQGKNWIYSPEKHSLNAVTAKEIACVRAQKSANFLCVRAASTNAGVSRHPPPPSSPGPPYMVWNRVFYLVHPCVPTAFVYTDIFQRERAFVGA